MKNDIHSTYPQLYNVCLILLTIFGDNIFTEFENSIISAKVYFVCILDVKTG